MNDDVIKKVFSEIAENSDISERIRAQFREKRSSMEKSQKNSLYGYKVVGNGHLVIDELPAENVKFIFRKVEEYSQNPPAELVERILEEYEAQGTILTYEEAVPLVSLSAVQEYVAEELSIKNMAFDLSNASKTIESLQTILARPFADFPVDDVRRAYQDKMEIDDSNSELNWIKRVRKVSRNSVYTGTLTLDRCHSSSARKQSGCEQLEFVDHHEAIVSKEQFEKVSKALKKESSEDK